MATTMYVSNPRDAKGRFKRRARNPRPARAELVVHGSRSFRPRSPSSAEKLLTEEIALRRALATAARAGVKSPRKRKAGGRKASSGRQMVLLAPNPLSMMNPLSVANPGRRRRRNGKGGRKGKGRARRFSNPRDRRGRFLKASGRRRNGGRRKNALSLANPVGNIPVIGTVISLIGPAFLGGIVVEVTGQLVGLVSRMWPDFATSKAANFSFTIGGFFVASVVELMRFIPAPYRRAIAAAAATAGVAVDWYRWRNASSAYGDLTMLGDGGNWSVELGDDEAYGNLEVLGDLAGDEQLAPADFTVEEGKAAEQGYGAFQSQYPVEAYKRGAPGHRWHWMARCVGAENFNKIPHMAPEERIRQIAACKAAWARRHGRPVPSPAFPHPVAGAAPQPRMIAPSIQPMPLETPRRKVEPLPFDSTGQGLF